MLVNAPLFHVSGLYAGAVTSLANGLKTVWTTGRFDPVRVMQLIERGARHDVGADGQHDAPRAHPSRVRAPRLLERHATSARAARRCRRALRAHARRPSRTRRRSVGIGYGLTESTALATINGRRGAARAARTRSAARCRRSRSRSATPTGRPVAEGDEGEIHMRGPLVMREYWRRPQETAEAIAAGALAAHRRRRPAARTAISTSTRVAAT